MHIKSTYRFELLIFVTFLSSGVAGRSIRSVVNMTATVKTKAKTSEHNVNTTEAKMCSYQVINPSHQQTLFYDFHSVLKFSS